MKTLAAILVGAGLVFLGVVSFVDVSSFLPVAGRIWDRNGVLVGIILLVFTIIGAVVWAGRR